VSNDGMTGDWGHRLQQRLLDRQARHREADRRRPWVRDLILPLALLVGTAAAALNGQEERGPFPHERSWPVWVVLLAMAALVTPLFWRRRAPLVAFSGVAAVLLAEWAFGIFIPTAISLLVAIFSVARRASMRALAWTVGATAGMLSLAAFVLFPGPNRTTMGFLLMGTATAAVALGMVIRTRGAYTKALEDRAARLETERDQRARLAASAERTRITREMHDIVGHHVSIIIGLADGGATLAATLGERSEEPLRLIAETGRQALGELRLVLGVLREESPAPPHTDDASHLNGSRPKETQPEQPQPGIGDLDRLLAGVRSAGLTVGYRTSGDLRNLAPGLQLTIYRIVQEALTNTLKHAGAGASAEVEVAADRGEVRVRVRDNGSGSGSAVPRAEPDGDNARQGVLGIRERAGLYGGTVTAGPEGTGWIVDVVMREPA
jgi:signal transduction histidine kinase